jgi:DNA-directed RNA polymerase subunit RPC12/RpoP
MGLGLSARTDAESLPRAVLRRVRRKVTRAEEVLMREAARVNRQSGIRGVPTVPAWASWALWALWAVILVNLALSSRSLSWRWLTSPWMVAAIAIGIVWTLLTRRSIRTSSFSAELVAEALLSEGRCPSCGQELAGLPKDAGDGCVVCPECGAAWEIPEASCERCAAKVTGLARCARCGKEMEEMQTQR